MWMALLSFIGGPVVGGLIKAYQAKLTVMRALEARARRNGWSSVVFLDVRVEIFRRRFEAWSAIRLRSVISTGRTRSSDRAAKLL